MYPSGVGGRVPVWTRSLSRDGVFGNPSGSAKAEDRRFSTDASPEGPGVPIDTNRRAYITSTLRVRLHQRAFRERVLLAYQQQCALCRLRHEELLDAAHIIPDADEGGEPVVPNGLALCKLHHAAYERLFLTVRPDYVIEVRRSILEEEDGPMLLQPLKGMHEKRIVLPKAPRLRPDPERLEKRWRQFEAAS